MAREKRKQRRQYLEYRAHIDLGDGSPVRPCLLADVSEKGARLKLETPGIMPNQFMLLLAAGAGNVRRRCDVVWVSGRQLGVRFRPANEIPLCLSVALDV